MSIPTVPVSVKFPPDEIPQIKGLAEARGFESVSEYMRHLVAMDKELLHRQYLALTRSSLQAHQIAKGTRGMTWSSGGQCAITQTRADIRPIGQATRDVVEVLGRIGPSRCRDLLPHLALTSSVISKYLRRAEGHGLVTSVKLSEKDHQYTAVDDWQAIADQHGTKEEPAPVWPEIPHQVTVQEWPQAKPVAGPHNPWGAA